MRSFPSRWAYRTGTPSSATRSTRSAPKSRLTSAGAGPWVIRVHAHDSIMEQVRLHDTPPVDGSRVADPDQVGLGQPVRLAPHPAPDLGADAAQPDAHPRGTADRAGQPRHRQHLDE